MALVLATKIFYYLFRTGVTSKTGATSKTHRTSITRGTSNVLPSNELTNNHKLIPEPFRAANNALQVGLNKPLLPVSNTKFSSPQVACVQLYHYNNSNSSSEEISSQSLASLRCSVERLYRNERSYYLQGYKNDPNSSSVFMTEGTVKTFLSNGNERPFGFIKNNATIDFEKNNDIFFSFQDVSSNQLWLRDGDRVEYRLAVKKTMQKPKASKVNVTYLIERSDIQISEYLVKVCDNLTDVQSDVIKYISSTCVWQQLTRMISWNISNDLSILLIRTLLHINSKVKTLNERFKEVLVSITQTFFFKPNHGRLKQLIESLCENTFKNREKLTLIENFLLVIANSVPKKIAAIAVMIKPLVKKQAISSEFLYKLVKASTIGCQTCIGDVEFKDLPLVLSNDEIDAPDGLALSDLKQVQVKGSYSSPDEYIDVYFRLLREDCLGSIREGISKLLSGNLDECDIKVYKSICLQGISITANIFCLAVKFEPCFQVKNLEYSTNLMVGNLLCLSFNGTFKDAVWLTVASREYIGKRIVVVQICDAVGDQISEVNILHSLMTKNCSAVMIESPVYYKAYQPILKCLKLMEPDQISFISELVSLQYGPLPEFLNPNELFDGGIVYKNKKDRQITLATFLNSSYSSDSVFDSSQESAVKKALRNRIGIIQGPPGCGKSFIGVQMLRLLLSLSSCNNRKVLVLTYKNHALDEFLISVLKYFPKENVIRLGGGCKDQSLSDISLFAYKKNIKIEKILFQQINELKDEIRVLKQEIDTKFKELNEAMSINKENVFDIFQVESLIQTCLWTEAKISLNEVIEAAGKDFKESFSQKNPSIIANEIFIERDRYSKSFSILKKKVINAWLPDSKVFSQLESKLNEEVKPKNFVIQTKRIGNKRLDELEDLKYVKELENERVSAINESTNGKEDILNVNYAFLSPGINNIKAFSTYAFDAINKSYGAFCSEDILWDLPLEERAILVQLNISQKCDQLKKLFQDLTNQYKCKCLQLTELQNQHTATILKEKKIIGMTITCAAIQQSLLKEIEPDIVLVEEAAEILEPQLVACIGTWTKYLLMIGDHQQLRPPVETFVLKRDFSFDISLMERLINNQLTYGTLHIQNRQREELADLLKDIYPNLTSNTERVSLHEKASCIAESCFFWDHKHPETSDRSYSNLEESKRAVKLALYLIHHGYLPQQITILAAYQKQVTLIRSTLKTYLETYSSVRKIADYAKLKEATVKSEERSIKVHTIDMYQGDENDFVIVSLVRSNEKSKIGFLEDIGRRCVAQSRARCGVYFIGNSSMFKEHSTWRKLMNQLNFQKRIGESLHLICKYHNTIKYSAKDSEDINFAGFCNSPCSFKMRCQIHDCKKKCQPLHSHSICTALFQFIHPKCGHPGQRKCLDPPGICNFNVSVVLQCSHRAYKPCSEDASQVKCKENCARQCKDGHACIDHLCFQHHTTLKCSTCIKISEDKMKMKRLEEENIRQENIRMVEKKLGKLILLNKEIIKRDEIFPTGESASEYLTVADMVLKYTQPVHDWFPKIKKIEKVTNTVLKKKWLNAKKDLFDPEHTSQLKFHGTGDEGIMGITVEGFRLPKSGSPMYGLGVYFASDSSKSAQEIYTKGSDKLLLCEVLLGKSFTVKKAWNNASLEKLRELQCDSLFAPRGTKDTGGVLYDEYIIFNPDQAFPKYIIHYTSSKLNLDVSFGELKFASGKKEIQPSRCIDINNELDMHFSMVESRFHRYMGISHSYRITQVDFFQHYKLKKQFENKHLEFKEKYGKKNDKSKVIFGFHGTKSYSIVENIMNDNFKPSANGKFGPGVYFSETPSYTFTYGGMNHLILAMLLPGETENCKDVSWNPSKVNCDSRGGFLQTDGHFLEIVIQNPDQILPCYVIHFS